MKILRIISFGFTGGGAETGVVEVDEILRDKGHEVKIISSNAHPEKKHFSDYEFGAINPKNPLKIFFHLLNISAFLTVRRVLKTYKPDIVHLHTMGEVSPLVLLLFRNTPTVMTIHGPEFFIPKLLVWTLGRNNFKSEEISVDNLNPIGRINYFYFKNIQGSVYKYSLKNVNIIIRLTTNMQKLVKRELKPNLVVNNGIKLLKYKQNKYGNNLLYVGRVEKYKGIEYVLFALPKIVKKYPKTIFFIAGEGTYKKTLTDLVKKLHLENHVRFLGWVDHKNLERTFENTNIVIMPSFWPEAFGKSGVEGMSKGRPVIASRVGGISEWLEHGKTGYLVDPKNSEQIAKYVIRLFDNKKLMVTMGKNARKRAELFSIEKYADSLEQVYRNQVSST